MRAAAFPRNVGSFDVGAHDLRPAEIVPHRIGNRLERAVDFFPRVGGGHCCRATRRVKLRDLRHRFDGALHCIAPHRAMNVHVDETGCYKPVMSINDLCVFRPKHLRGRRDLLDPAVFDDDTVMLQHAVRTDNATVDDNHHDPRSMASPG